MRLNPTDFDRLLNGLGQNFTLRKAFACPCVNPHSGAAKPNCPFCEGKGRQWTAGVDGKAAVVSRNAMRKVVDIGFMDAGDMMISIPSDSPIYQIGQFDRVLTRNRTEPFSKNMVRGQNDVLKLPVLLIERAYWIDKTGQMVEAEPPTVGADGVLSWRANAPPMGTTYSLTGRQQQEYFVYQEMPFDRPMHFGSTLPRRVILRRFDLLGR